MPASNTMITANVSSNAIDIEHDIVWRCALVQRIVRA
jgi:hypothetical protein